MEKLSEDLAAKDAEFGPALDDVQAALEAFLGPLEWEQRRPAALTHLIEGYDVKRVGPVVGRGVILPGLDIPGMQRTIEKALGPYGFATTKDLQGSASGTLIYKATDVDGAIFTMTCKVTVNAWVDVRVR